MKTRRIINATVIAMSLFVLGNPVSAASNVGSVTIQYVNGALGTLNHEDYIISNGYILVDPSYVVGVLPFEVPSKAIDWTGSKKTLEISAWDPNVIGERKEGFSITVGDKEFHDKVLGNTFQIPQDAEIMKDGHVYLPIRAISEAYGFVVTYSKTNGTILIAIERGNSTD